MFDYPGACVSSRGLDDGAVAVRSSVESQRVRHRHSRD